VTSSGAPRYAWESHRRTDVDVHASYRQLMSLETIDDVKKSVCSVAEVGFVESPSYPEKGYELPDGSTLRVGRLRQLIPEMYFRPEVVELFSSVMSAHVTTAWHQLHVNGAHQPLQRLTPPIKNVAGEVISQQQQPFELPRMINWSLGMTLPEPRRDLCNHILLTGGASCLPGLAQRLKWETLAAIPQAFKPRLVVPSPAERANACWVGGSVLASLGTFQQLWVSKEEYLEHGGSIIESKCH
jgi:actin-related protein